MQPHAGRDLTLPLMISPLLVAAVFIALCSLIKEPARRNFSAIMMAGAGAAYLGGGLGVWEFPFCALITFLAYRGLADYRFIGMAWLLHAAWDVAHHFYGNPIVPFAPTSSAGCAICDVALAAWYLLGAPSIYPQAPAARRAPSTASPRPPSAAAVRRGDRQIIGDRMDRATARSRFSPPSPNGGGPER
jgi:hypothetical protein